MSSEKAMPPVPIADAYWVLPGRLLAGEYPGSHTFIEGDDRGGGDIAVTRTRIRQFLDAGIDYFIDLTDGNDGLAPYSFMLWEESTPRGVEVIHRRLSIADRTAPSIEYVQDVLDEIGAALAHNHKVYVHCWGGIGRTGVIVGCFLARHGIAHGEAALNEIENLRRYGSKTEWRSPETEEQRDLVRNWKQGQ